MKKEELEKLVEKCRELSAKYIPINEEKATLYERIADQLESDIDIYLDNELFMEENEVIDDIKNMFDEVDNFYDEEDYENMNMLD